jgi:hydroxymethylbilane synthase
VGLGRIRIGTRGSPLALRQAHQIKDSLQAAHDLDPNDLEIIIIKTSGDRIQDKPLSEVGGKGLFTKEIEEALLAGTIDIAVHSMKDVETVLPGGLVIDCFPPREDVRDAFISLSAPSLAGLPAGARIGTSSLRRQSQVLRLRPDLTVVPFRGNVETRLGKLASGVADATILAMAGLRRLGADARVTEIIEPDVMLPAVAQGAIGIQARAADTAFRDLLKPLHHATTALCVTAERALLAGLDGSCRTPIAGLAELSGTTIRLRGMVLSTDGARSHSIERAGAANDAVRLGADAAAELLAQAGPGFLAQG